MVWGVMGWIRVWHVPCKVELWGGILSMVCLRLFCMLLTDSGVKSVQIRVSRGLVSVAKMEPKRIQKQENESKKLTK